MSNNDRQKQKKNVLLRYAALSTELLVLLGLAVWCGLWLDQKTGLAPLFLIVLPLAALALALVRLYRNLK